MHIYGAAALASFGFVVARWLRFEPGPWAGLWFAGALFAYNIDRLARDPADAINVPRRVGQFARLRKISAALAAAALLALIVIPMLQRDWLLLALVTAGALFCAAYSVAIMGPRLKDIPLLKTFLVPTAATASLLVPPWLQQGLRVSATVCVCAYAAVWCLIFFNVLLCDLRDIEGDTQTGTSSLPVLLGAAETRRLLAVVLAATVALCALSGWNLLAAFCALYMGALLLAVRKRRSEQFYEWWVEGMLFLPAAACLLRQAGLDSF
jgi:4-hydroxybenzoate polyprenyltransferase